MQRTFGGITCEQIKSSTNLLCDKYLLPSQEPLSEFRVNKLIGNAFQCIFTQTIREQ